MMELKTEGVIIFIPTILLALFLSIITYKSDHFLPNVAVSCWIAANGTWMLGEFFQLSFKPLALSLFVAGSIIISAYFIIRSRASLSDER